MVGKWNGSRDDKSQHGDHRAKSPAGTSFKRTRPLASHLSGKLKPNSASAPRPGPTLPKDRADPAGISESRRGPQKFPGASALAFTTPTKPDTSAPRHVSNPSSGTMSRKFDNVHSLDALIEKENSTPTQPRNRAALAAQSKSKTKTEKFDIRADDSDSDDSDSNSDSDSDSEVSASFLNGSIVTNKPAGTPLKKAKRGKDDEVADSDIERKASAAKPAKKAPVKPESSSEEEEESETESKASESSDSDSDSEKPAAVSKKVTTSTNTSSTSPSDSDSESEIEAAKPVKNSAKKLATKSSVNGVKTAKSSQTVVSSSESSSEEEDASGDKQSNGEESDDEADNTAAVATRNNKESSVAGFVGKDFVLRQAQGDEEGKDIAEFFAKAKRDGKQLWYFTAPASIPINVVEKVKIPTDKAQNGDSIFKHNSEDYTAGFDNGVSTSIQVVIPNKKGGVYATASRKVDKVLHFKRVTQLSTGVSAPRTLTSQPDAPRPQPVGMRARFRPIGVSDDTPMGKIGDDTSDEDVEMTTAPAPSTSKKSKRVSMQATDSMDIDEPTPKSSKKDKKKSKVARDAQSTIIEVPNSQPLPSEKSKKRRDSIESISSVGSNAKGLSKSQKTPKASKRKHSEAEQEAAATQPEETASTKKAKKLKRDDSTPASAKKQTAIAPPVYPKPGYSFSNLPIGSPAPQTATPQTKKSKTAKETPIRPPTIARESAVPVPSATKQASPAQETPKEKRKRRKSEKTEEPKSDKKETPIPIPKLS